MGLHTTARKAKVGSSPGRQVVSAWNQDKNMIIEAEANVPLANYGVVEELGVYSGNEVQHREKATGKILSHVSGEVKQHGIDTLAAANANNSNGQAANT